MNKQHHSGEEIERRTAGPHAICELAYEFGFTEKEFLHIRWGALLHDIGKMGVPDNILLKPEPLTEERSPELHS